MTNMSLKHDKNDITKNIYNNYARVQNDKAY